MVNTIDAAQDGSNRGVLQLPAALVKTVSGYAAHDEIVKSVPPPGRLRLEGMSASPNT
jgi:hypothetical protein